MKLLVAHTVELGLVIAAWAYLGQLLVGPEATTVSTYVNGYTVALLLVAQTLVAIAFSMMAVYWIPLVVGTGIDWRHSRATVKRPPTFAISPFLIGCYLFVLTCKVLLAGMATALVSIVGTGLAEAVTDQQFAANLVVLDPLATATSTFSLTLGLLAALTAFLVIELFVTVHTFGWEQAKAKYGIVKK